MVILMTRSTRNKSLIENTAILFIALGITKLVGAILKIPLANILGGLGMSYFSSAYSVFGPVFALTAAAIPTVMTKLVAQYAAAGNYKNVRKLKQVSLKAAAMLGFTGTILILVITVPFARFVADAPKSIPSMLIIAPSVFFCCIAAVYRGYFEGLRNTMPTAISQVIEAVVKASFGITFSYIVLVKTDSLPYAAAAAVLAVTVSEACGLMFILLRGRAGDGITREELDNSPEAESGVALLRRFFRDAFPVMLGALAVNLSSLIDLMTISSSINLSVSRNKAYFLQHFIYDKSGLQGGVELADLGNFIYGSYTGIVASLVMLIPAMTGMLSKSVLPAVAAAWERDNKLHLCRNLKILFKGTFVLGLPLCIGMAAFAEPVLTLLYAAKPAEAYVCIRPLFILSLGAVTLSLTVTLFSIFQAIGRADLPVKLMLAGASVKLVMNIWLLRIPEMNIAGAALATVGCYTVICIIGFIMLARLIQVRIGITGFFVKALFNALACGAAALLCYNYIFTDMPRFLRLGFSIAAGGGVYMLLTAITDRKVISGYLPKRGKC